MNADTATPAVCFHQVTFGFGATPVLQDATLDVEAGRITCVVGPNGGGKTTFVRLALGLLRPQRGTVRVFGRDPAHARDLIGYVPQHPKFDALFPATVLDVALMGRHGHGPGGWLGRNDRRAALDALDRVEMADLARRHFAELSGGQRQRVLIARALAGRPRLLVLDEPTSNIDALGEERLVELLSQLPGELSVLLVSHDLEVVSALVDRVVCVNRRVSVHPTAEMTGDELTRLYGAGRRLVRHDHDLGTREHTHHE